MLNVSCIGIGNAGSQVAALAGDTLHIPVLAINSSEKDIETLPKSCPHILIGEEKGAGKERSAAKLFLKSSIINILSDEKADEVLKADVIFVISSTGGGTGSGTALMMANIIQEIYASAQVILIGILPTLKEAYSTQINTVAYMEELYKTLGDDTTYMIYDNEKLAKLPSTVMMSRINQAIVEDIDVIRGSFQYPTRFSSIDEKDATNIISTPGRIVIASLRNLKEKDLDDTTIENLLIEQFKTNAHCEIQRDKIVKRTGLISLLSERLNETLDTHLAQTQKFLGAPTEEFEHIVVHSERQMENAVFLIAAGMSQINDRIRRINDRIMEIDEQQSAAKKDDDELSSMNLAELSAKVTRRTARDASDNVDVREIMAKFGV